MLIEIDNLEASESDEVNFSDSIVENNDRFSLNKPSANDNLQLNSASSLAVLGESQDMPVLAKVSLAVNSAKVA